MKKAFILVLFLFLVPLASAFEITTQPETLSFENILVNGLAEKKITIMTDSSDNVDVNLVATGTFEDWITITPATAKINSNNPAEFTLTINPLEAQLGTYKGLVVVNAVYTGNQLTSAVTSATDINLEMTVTDKEIIQARVSNAVVDNTETGQPVNVKLYILNEGNTEINPLIGVTLLDSQKVPLQTTTHTASVLPSSDESEIIIILNNDLALGDYYIESKAFLNELFIGQQNVPFKIVEPGTLPPPEKVIDDSDQIVTLSSTPTFIVLMIIFAVFIFYAVKGKKKFFPPPQPQVKNKKIKRRK